MTLLTRLVEIMEEIEQQRLCFPGIICLQYDNSRPDRVGVLHVDVDLSGMRRGCGEDAESLGTVGTNVRGVACFGPEAR